MTYKECYEILKEKMDKRDIFMKKLLEWYKKYNSVPKEYISEFKIFRSEGFLSWRQQPKVIKKIKKAAKKASRSKGLDNLSNDEKILAVEVFIEKLFR